MFHPEDTLSTFCGSPHYASPGNPSQIKNNRIEMVLAKIYTGPEVDVWSIGVILYALLSGQLPFKEKDSTELYSNIANAIYTIPPHFSQSKITCT